MQSIVVGRQGLLGRREPVTGDPLHLPRGRAQVGERIGPRIPRDLERVGHRGIQPGPDPSVELHVDPSGVPEIGVCQDVDVHRLPREGGVVVRPDPVGWLGHEVFVVRRHVEHEVGVERVPHAELEQDRLPERYVSTELVVCVREGQVVVVCAIQKIIVSTRPLAIHRKLRGQATVPIDCATGRHNCPRQCPCKRNWVQSTQWQSAYFAR